MEKGWGVTLENSEGVFGRKSAGFGFNLSPTRFRNEGLVMFPVSLNGRDENNNNTMLSPRRVVLGEVDFFSDRRRSCNEVNAAAMKNEASHGDDEDLLDVNTGLQLVTVNTGSDQSTVDDGVSCDAEYRRAKNELAQLHVELERMNAENMRLRGMLGQVSNNYTTLQMHLVTLMQQQQQHQQQHNSIDDNLTQNKQEIAGKSEQVKQENEGGPVPRQFLDLAPGATAGEPSNSSSGERTLSGSPHNTALEAAGSRNKRTGRDESPESQGWGPNKAPKTNTTPTPKPVDQSAEATMRKVRVSVRARSEAPMISDGCQWRKYGQKMAKGNPCRRAYYRCTMAVGCPVRKQVQRCAEDRAILITTYEGTHNHPLPPAAMAMASTTSAAANMLLSGSMPSADGMMNPNFLARTILPCSSNMATISASAPFPTVTLDLTQNLNPLQFQRQPTPFQIPFPTPPQNFAPVPNPSNVPQVFSQALYNQSKFSGLQMSNDINEAAQVHQTQPHPSFADTLSAATAAITADPNFTAALAAAISSIIGGSSQPNDNSNNNNNSSPNNVNTSNINRTGN